MMSERSRASLVEPLVTFAIATALASALYWTALSVRFVQDLLHGGIAVIFMYAPAAASRISGRPFDYLGAGLTVRPISRNAIVLAAALLIAWPLFFGAFLSFYSFVCRMDAPALARAWADLFAPICPLWRGLAGARFRLPENFLVLALSQLVVVAVPEELFFRGYLLGRLEERWPSSRRLLGAPVGKALVISSLLFALGHVLVDFQLQRFAVFFPGLLFGWMRARSGSIAAAAVFHALCNLLSEVLHTSFFYR